MIADVLGVSRRAARQQAGYPVQLKARVGKKKRRTALIEMMLHELKHDTNPNARIMRLFGMFHSYFEKRPVRVNLERLEQIAETFTALDDLSYAQRTEAWERVKKVLAEACGLPFIFERPQNATMILRKGLWPVVFRGAHVKVSIEQRSPGGDVEWFSYVVKDIREKTKKTVAKLEYIGQSVS